MNGNAFPAGPLGDQPNERRATSLATTFSGLRFVNSPLYEKVMAELVDRNYEPNESFYELLIGVTATFLCEADPHEEDIEVFDTFIAANIEIIRAAIDRVKTSRWEVGHAEKKWLHAGLRR